MKFFQGNRDLIPAYSDERKALFEAMVSMHEKMSEVVERLQRDETERRAVAAVQAAVAKQAKQAKRKQVRSR